MRSGAGTEYVARLTGLFQQAAQGGGAVALVSGHFGHGKTAVLTAVAENVEADGGLVLRATASAAERAVRLGVIDQLLQSCPQGRAGVARLMRLVEEGAQKAPDTHSALGVQGDASWAEAVRGMWSALQRLSETGTVLIVVDDIGFADIASLDCLLYFARRVASTRILLLVSEQEHPPSDGCVVHRELRRLRHFHSVRLTPLPAPAIARLLARHMSEEAARRWSKEYTRATGGNPRLVVSLLRDHTNAVEPSAARPAAGQSFESAVVSLAHAYGPTVLGAARGLAMLGEWSSARLLSHLIGIDPAGAAQAVDALTEAGLLAAEKFRHPAAAAAVRHDMPPAERCDLHLRTAELLYGEGAPAGTVAAHLLAAPAVGVPWTVAVLEEAADEALGADRLQLATDSLKLALRACTDDDRRAALTMKLALARWRADPVLAARHYPELVDALRAGRLRGKYTAMLLRSLLWYGRFDAAAEALERLAADPQDGEAAAELRLTHLRLRHTYPALSARVRHVEPAAAEHAPATMVLKTQANTLLAAVLHDEAPQDLQSRTEQILSVTTMNDLNLDTLQAAMLALIYGNHTEAAALWCDRLLAHATTRQAPSWTAVFTAIQAEIDIRQGDPAGAEKNARTALRLITPRGWGAAAGAPLAVLVQALTATGRHDEAAAQLGEELPESSFQTRYGLHFLAARAQHYLATHQFAAALTDFLSCGETMTGWGMDVASLVPWRTGAAEAYLRMGEPRRGRELAEQQLARPAVEGTRAHGLALRVLAATTPDPDRRRSLYADAVTVFEKCGDRYELARALADAALSCLAAGDRDGACTDALRARALARQLGAEPVLEELRAAGLEAMLPPEEKADPTRFGADSVEQLSDAERRVARLAALGRTNRDIAAELFITVSTVEQHLTRAYRKLGVSRRMDLPATLHLERVTSE